MGNDRKAKKLRLGILTIQNFGINLEKVEATR